MTKTELQKALVQAERDREIARATCGKLAKELQYTKRRLKIERIVRYVFMYTSTASILLLLAGYFIRR